MGLVAALSVLFVVPKALNPVSLYVNTPSATAGVKPQPTDRAPHWFPKLEHSGAQQPKSRPLPNRILALGDSVMLGCSAELEMALHHRVRIDARVGRQIDDTIRDLAKRRKRHRLPKDLVLQIGNNGPLWYRDLVRLRRALRGIPDIVVVNVRNDTSWQGESNHALVSWLAGWPAAHLADWYGSSTNKMLSDGTHPWPYGCAIYARVIADALRSA